MHDAWPHRTTRSLLPSSLPCGTAAGARAHDACGAMDAIGVSHTEQLLPRVRECDTLAEALCMRCTVGKNRMTGELVRVHVLVHVLCYACAHHWQKLHDRQAGACATFKARTT